jgi:hypothetical protein
MRWPDPAEIKVETLESFRLFMPDVDETQWPGLLGCSDFKRHIEGVLDADLALLKTIGSRHPRQGLNALANLLLECAPLLELDAVRAAMVTAISRRDRDFLGVLMSSFPKAPRGQRDQQGFLSPAHARDWREVESRLLSGTAKTVSAACLQVSSESKRGKPIDPESVARNHRRAETEFPNVKAKAVVVAMCDGWAETGSIHRVALRGASPELSAFDRRETRYVFPSVQLMLGSGPLPVPSNDQAGDRALLMHLDRVQLQRAPLHERGALRPAAGRRHYSKAPPESGS